MTATRPEGARRIVTLDVLGGLGLRVEGVPLSLPNRKARALFAYLALEGRPVGRERLAGLFWSQATERHARSSLRQTVMELRDALERARWDGLRAGRDDLDVDHSALAVDLDGVLAAVRGGSMPDRSIERACSVDQLLAGYEDLSPGFRDWLQARRRAAQTSLLRELEHGYANPGRSRRERRRLAEAAVRIEPLNEDACRTAMRLAAEDGEIGAALRSYAALYELLGAELDMEPSEATQVLVAEIKQGLHSGPTNPVPSGRPAQAAPSAAPFAAPFAAPGAAPVVAILPLRPIGSDPNTAIVAEGLVEDVVRVLAGLREPLVISANSTRGLRDTAMGLPRIGEMLGAHYLVSGSVRLVGDAARISVELAEATTGAVLWASAYDCPGSGLLDAQERIAGGIANALVPQVGAAELRRNRVARQDAPGAYHVLLRARDLIFTLERPAFEGAAALLRKAIALDPEYSPAYATMADWHSLRLFQGWSDDPEADLAGIEGSAQTAIRLDPNNARALAILGHNRMLSARDYEGAMDLFDKALAAAPNDAEAWMWSSPTYAYAGTPAEAIARAERALALSPCDPLLFRYEHFLCIAHYAAGDLEAAVHWGQRSLASNPNYTSNLRMTVASLAGLGRAPEAAPLVRRAMRVEPNFRVQSMIARQAFRDEAARHRYGERLLAAGFPR